MPVQQRTALCVHRLRTPGPARVGERFLDQAIDVSALKFLIADDHHLVREGLKLAVREISAEVALLEAETLQEAVTICSQVPDIDLVLLDLAMPGAQGSSAFDVLAAKCPGARVVVVSATCDMDTVQGVIRKGALGFIPKLAGKAALIGALRFVLNGGIYVPPEVFAGAQVPPPGARSTPTATAAARGKALDASGLTNRQIDVLRELLQGKSNKQICRDLNLAMGTIKVHVAALLHVLGVSSRAEAIVAAERLGWRAALEAGGRPEEARPPTPPWGAG